MSSFDGITIKERGAGGGQGYPTWSKASVTVIKKIPGSDDSVIQVIGQALPRLALPAHRMTYTQLSGLQAAIGTTATLAFYFETTTAKLESVTNVEQFRDWDVYSATLNFIRSDSTFTIPSTSILLEDGSPILLEDGTFLLLE